MPPIGGGRTRREASRPPIGGTRKSTPKTSAATTQNLEAIWDQVGPELSAVLQGQAEIPSDLTPFDAASDLTMDQQKVEAMKRIQLELKQGNFEQAVGLLRASR
ncbi:hypothetical protein J6590_017241 [Homalodisca vitripennis]|nr:hypothetical protein J6590_017241 [Homalodisca vitripennis]